MEDEPTCGKGLAENSALPAQLGELIGSVAAILEWHRKALDLSDENARKEDDAYRQLAEEHRRLAAGLQALASRMAGYRDLPMGHHDEKAMSDPKALEAFQELVRREQQFLAWLQKRVPEHSEMLQAMGADLGT